MSLPHVQLQKFTSSSKSSLLTFLLEYFIKNVHVVNKVRTLCQSLSYKLHVWSTSLDKLFHVVSSHAPACSMLNTVERSAWRQHGPAMGVGEARHARRFDHGECLLNRVNGASLKFMQTGVSERNFFEHPKNLWQWWSSFCRGKSRRVGLKFKVRQVACSRPDSTIPLTPNRLQPKKATGEMCNLNPNTVLTCSCTGGKPFPRTKAHYVDLRCTECQQCTVLEIESSGLLSLSEKRRGMLISVFFVARGPGLDCLFDGKTRLSF